MMLRYMLVVISIAAVVCWQGCSQSEGDEPPFSFGQGKPGDLVRQTELKDFSPANNQIVYEVKYPAFGLTSMATLGFPMKEMTAEVFEGRWTVIYLYDEMINRVTQLPTRIEIYRYTPGSDHRGQLINDYTFVSVPRPGTAKYTDRQGRSRLIDIGYFSILPGGP